MNKKIITAVSIAVGVIGIGGFLFYKDAQVTKYSVNEDNKNISQLGDTFENLGSEHIKDGAEHKPYNSNPPTSGPHYFQPAEWGVYPNQLKDEQLVHNLEHGGIWISYKDIDPETKAKLETIGKANPGSVIVTPRPENDAKVVIASWTRLQKLDSFDETKILAFIKANKNKSPEPLAR